MSHTILFPTNLSQMLKAESDNAVTIVNS